jgi:ATP-binding cassette subfamily F protein uup
MDLIRCTDLCMDFGFGPLLDSASVSLQAGERVCLVGRNGTGKTTLMKILAGIQPPDTGSVEPIGHCRVAYMQQALPRDLDGSIESVVLSGAGACQTLLDYEEITANLGDAPSDALLDRMQNLQDELDRLDAWNLRSEARAEVDRLKLDPEGEFSALSGGMKRQVLFLRALLARPDVLILDEPTNHLDTPTILWLEGVLKSFNGALLFVTHDRQFLSALATRILDLDRGQLTSWPGNYERYQELKEASLDAESKAWSEFDKHLAQEEVWIRQGIQARRTRNEGRVRSLKRLRDQRQERRQRIGQVKMSLATGERSGKRVIEVTDMGFSFPDKPIIEGLEIELGAGDRLGILGPNGCGKTTLIRLLLGDLMPQRGEVKLGTKLKVVYFDQMRGTLDDDRSVVDNLADGADTVTLNGQPKHVIGYLRDFLFSPERARSRVGILSGGERNRLLLAKLFLQPANLLVMDEPTNDLDCETLEMLESVLLDYPGTLLLVSHDRAFVNNVVTSVLAFDADGICRHYAGGYDDWQRQRPKTEVIDTPKAAPQRVEKKTVTKKLSFNESQELASLPERLEVLEAQKDILSKRLADPELYTKQRGQVSALQAELEAAEAELSGVYERWELLESKTD